jgi:plastocyanin
MRVGRLRRWCPVLLAAALVAGCGTGKQAAGPGPEAARPEAPVAATPAPGGEMAAPAAIPELPPPAPELSAPGAAPAPAPSPAPEVSAPGAAPPPPAASLPPVAPVQTAPGAAFELHFPEEATTQPPPPRSEPETYEVYVPDRDYRFIPRLLYIYEGDTVVWHNKSGVVHLFATIPGSDPTGYMEIEPSDLLVGARVPHTFAKAGTYPYFCFIHNRMTGKIIVLPRPN